MAVENPLPLLSLSDLEEQIAAGPLTPESMKILAAWNMASLIAQHQPTSLAIGSGTTSQKVVQAIGEFIRAGRIKPTLRATTTSQELYQLSLAMGLTPTEPFETTLNHIRSIINGNTPPEPSIAYGFDGADEIKVLIDRTGQIVGFHSIKGGGGAHTLEKIIAQMTADTVFVIDETKLVSNLGEKFYLPLEVISAGIKTVQHKLLAAYSFTSVELKKAGNNTGIFTTDLGNPILMAKPQGPFTDPEGLEQALVNDPNIAPYLVDTGFFLSTQPHSVLVARRSGRILTLSLGDTIKPDNPFIDIIRGGTNSSLY